MQGGLYGSGLVHACSMNTLMSAFALWVLWERSPYWTWIANILFFLCWESSLVSPNGAWITRQCLKSFRVLSKHSLKSQKASTRRRLRWWMTQTIRGSLPRRLQFMSRLRGQRRACGLCFTWQSCMCLVFGCMCSLLMCSFRLLPVGVCGSLHMCAFYVRNVKADLLLRVPLIFCIMFAVGLMHV